MKRRGRREGSEEERGGRVCREGSEEEREGGK